MTISIRDEISLFTAADVDAMRSASTAWRFDVHLIASSSYVSKAAFERAVSSAVDAPNVVAIGIDPTHRTTVVRFGDGSGVPRSAWSGVASAGDASFRSAQWAAGVEAIGARATRASEATTSVVVQRPRAQELHAGLYIGGALVVLVAAVTAFVVWRSRKRDAEHRRMVAELDAEIAEKRLRNAETDSWLRRFETAASKAAPAVSHAGHVSSSAPARPAAPRVSRTPQPAPVRVAAPAPIVRPGAPSTVVVNNGSSGSDLLLGYTLGSVSAERERPQQRRTESVSSYDSGGSSSSWSSSSSDSGGSSSSWSSSDSGGSSSSWDSGGGFDSGGGSSDW